MPRWLRVLILFLMVLSLVIYISPIQVQASSIVASIAGVTAVNVPAGLVYAAAAIALGVAAGTNDDFVNMVSNAVSAAGEWVKDGTVELLQTVDTLGQKTYYAAGQMMEDLRSFLFTEEQLLEGIATSYLKQATGSVTTRTAYTYNDEGALKYTYEYQIAGTNVFFLAFKLASRSDGFYELVAFSDSTLSGAIYRNGNFLKQVQNLATENIYYVSLNTCTHPSGFPVVYVSGPEEKAAYLNSLNLGETFYESDFDLTLGYLPSQTTDLTDGSSARAWSETYTDNGLYVVPGSNDPDPPDENNGKWFWPLAFALTAADLYALSQMDEWTGVTPPEFGDYETVEEFEILDVPEVDFGQGIEIAPVTSPSPDTGGDPGTDPDTGGDSSGEVQTDYTTWFSRLYTIVENISGKFDEIKTTFQTWITDCKTAIEAIPSKFADWFANIKTSVDTFASNAQDAWAQAIAGIQSLPASIADALANLMPEADPEQNPPSDLGNYTIDLKDFFPFCIPFDLYDFFTCLNADPVAPVIEWEIYLPGGEVYPLVLDLSVFDTVAMLLRRLQLLLFCTGLAFKTRDLIRG